MGQWVMSPQPIWLASSTALPPSSSGHRHLRGLWTEPGSHRSRIHCSIVHSSHHSSNTSGDAAVRCWCRVEPPLFVRSAPFGGTGGHNSKWCWIIEILISPENIFNTTQLFAHSLSYRRRWWTVLRVSPPLCGINLHIVTIFDGRSVNNSLDRSLFFSAPRCRWFSGRYGLMWGVFDIYCFNGWKSGL